MVQCRGLCRLESMEIRHSGDGEAEEGGEQVHVTLDDGDAVSWMEQMATASNGSEVGEAECARWKDAHGA